MKRKAQAAIPYLLMIAEALLFVLFVFNSYRKTPKTAEEIITKATNNYSTTASRMITTP